MNISNEVRDNFPEERPAQMSQRPNWEVIRLFGLIRYVLNREIPWYAVEADDVTCMKNVKAYYI